MGLAEFDEDSNDLLDGQEFVRNTADRLCDLGLLKMHPERTVMLDTMPVLSMTKAGYLAMGKSAKGMPGVSTGTDISWGKLIAETTAKGVITATTGNVGPILRESRLHAWRLHRRAARSEAGGSAQPARSWSRPGAAASNRQMGRYRGVASRCRFEASRQPPSVLYGREQIFPRAGVAISCSTLGERIGACGVRLYRSGRRHESGAPAANAASQ